VEEQRPLSAEETNRLRKLEDVIAKGQSAFIDVGAALAEIRSARLYRLSHKTFEAYCKDRLGLSRPYVHRIIDVKALGEVLGEAWPAIREVEEGEIPQATTIKLTAKLGPDGGHDNSKITSFAPKFIGRTISIKPEVKK
jgi:hypothetical protein